MENGDTVPLIDIYVISFTPHNNLITNINYSLLCVKGHMKYSVGSGIWHLGFKYSVLPI